MEIAKLVLEYIKVLIWPLVVFITVLLFRGQLRAILWRLRKADLPGGLSLDFQQEIQEAKGLSQQVAQQIEHTQVPDEKKRLPSIPLTEANARMLSLNLQPSPSGLDMAYYRNLAAQDPNVALAGLRTELEILAKNLAKGFKIEVDSRDSGLRLVQKLRDSGAITQEQLQLAQKILRLCNAAIHGQIISREEADGVIDVAIVLRDQYLRWLSWGFGDKWRPINKEE